MNRLTYKNIQFETGFSIVHSNIRISSRYSLTSEIEKNSKNINSSLLYILLKIKIDLKMTAVEIVNMSVKCYFLSEL